MFTRKRFVPPTTKDPDLKAFGKALSDYLISLEAKGSLNISQATIGIDQGLQFPATQVSSTDPNNLDDYEEGTWIPVDSSGAGLALTTTFAKYTKIGRAVVLAADITYPVTASGANVQIGGLPFANSGIHAGAVSATGGNPTVALIGVAGTVLLLTAAAVQLTNANLSGQVVRFTITYHV